MTDSDITTTILRQIRDELVGVRTAVQHTNERLDQTNERLENLTDEVKGTNERLTVVETVLRDVAAQVVFVGRYVKNKQDTAIADLRKRVVRLEKKVG